MADRPKKLRSSEWFGGSGRNAFMHRSWMKNQGLPADQFDGRPVIGICNTWSELTPCNAHLRDIAERVKRGVYEAGGLPLEFPVMSLGETNLRPTAMLFRNLASMDVEESIRGNPIDGVILLVGCDKTTPALLMGAASCDIPAIAVSGGPMLSGDFRGQKIGSGTHVWRVFEDVKAGKISNADFLAAEQGQSRSPGHCMTMGTASTMASMVEALGIGMPENAAIGGSSNFVLHMLAIAGRVGVPLAIDDFERLASELPCLVNLQPLGKYLMEDFCYAGGLPAVLKEIAPLLHRDAITANGRTIGQNIEHAENWNREVIKPYAEPFKANAGIAVLRGNLALRGAVIKPSAATPALMQHRGRAVVFEDIDDFHARIDDDALVIDESCVMVLKNCGPKGYPGMAEVGNMPLPPKVLRKGITDMVRISDARMSGTAYGTVVLHTVPEAADGGPLAVVRNGDFIELDVAARRLHLDVSDAELQRRLAAWRRPEPPLASGYWKLYVDHVLQADQGADLDFLVGKRGAFVPRDNH
jgi:dihydroxy-acid dehydratase